MNTHAQLGQYKAACPRCQINVTDLEAHTEEVWVLKDEFAGMVGLPVGPEYGRRVPVRTFITLRPCGHEVESIDLQET